MSCLCRSVEKKFKLEIIEKAKMEKFGEIFENKAFCFVFFVNWVIMQLG